MSYVILNQLEDISKVREIPNGWAKAMFLGPNNTMNDYGRGWLDVRLTASKHWKEDGWVVFLIFKNIDDGSFSAQSSLMPKEKAQKMAEKIKTTLFDWNSLPDTAEEINILLRDCGVYVCL